MKLKVSFFFGPRCEGTVFSEHQKAQEGITYEETGER